MMVRLILIPVVIFLLLKMPAFSENITVQGDVSGQWQYDTVFVVGDLVVPDGDNLLISPGCRVVFTGNHHFSVDGSLTAIGLPGDSIYFTIADTSGFLSDTIPGGGWGGIRFNHPRTTNDSSVFAYCRFEFGKVVDPEIMQGSGGAMFIDDYGKVRISHCTFNNNFARYNGGALYLDSANVRIERSVFNRNRAGLAVSPWGYGGGICSDNSNPEIRWNEFQNNSSTGVGGGLAVRFKDCNVYSNVFEGNNSALGGALGMLHMTDIVYRVDNNLMVNNGATFFGGGVASLDASPVYVNNTIAFNQAMYGGGFYCKDSVSPDFFNTIIWGNTASVGPQGYLFEVYSQADFFNCDVESGPMLFGGSGGGEAFFGTFESCIDADPIFIGNGDYPYALQWDSPCYDAGSWDTSGLYLPDYDLAGNPRISHAAIDIGAYEIAWVGIGAWGEEGMEAWGHGGMGAKGHGRVVVSPNPTTGKFKVQRSKFNDEFQKVEVVDLNGNILETLNSGNIELDIGLLPDGIYLIRIMDGDRILNQQKILKISP